MCRLNTNRKVQWPVCSITSSKLGLHHWIASGMDQQHLPPTILWSRQTQQFTHYLRPGANHRAPHRQTHTKTEMTSPHPESTNTHSVYFYSTHSCTICSALLVPQFLLIHWQACVVPDGYQCFMHLFLQCKLCRITNSSLYTEHMVEGN